MSKRQNILDTAVALFVRQGVESTPTSQISKISGVATGTLFHHFPTKDDLVKALVLETKASLYEAVTAGMGETSDFREQMQAVWLAHIRWAMNNPVLFNFKARMETLVKIDEQTQDALETMWRALSDRIAAGMEKGVFKSMPRDFLLGTLNAQVVFAAQHFMENPEEFSDPAIREQAFTTLWSSVAA